MDHQNFEEMLARAEDDSLFITPHIDCAAIRSRAVARTRDKLMMMMTTKIEGAGRNTHQHIIIIILIKHKIILNQI
jgi:hypothetical protein